MDPNNANLFSPESLLGFSGGKLPTQSKDLCSSSLPRKIDSYSVDMFDSFRAMGRSLPPAANKAQFIEQAAAMLAAQPTDTFLTMATYLKNRPSSYTHHQSTYDVPVSNSPSRILPWRHTPSQLPGTQNGIRHTVPPPTLSSQTPQKCLTAIETMEKVFGTKDAVIQRPTMTATTTGADRNDSAGSASSAISLSGEKKTSHLATSEISHVDLFTALGNTMTEKYSPYIDVSQMVDPTCRIAHTRGGVMEPFPDRLHRILREDTSGCVSFLPHGRAFVISDTERFEKDIMPKYFRQTRLGSFHRQLNLYGYRRVKSGRDAGAYFHSLFLKNRPSLCFYMRRANVSTTQRRKIGGRRYDRSANSANASPDFYAMPPVPEE